MKLKDQINQKLAQEISDDESIEIIIDEIVNNVTQMFPRNQEDETYLKIIERLKLFMGEK